MDPRSSPTFNDADLPFLSWTPQQEDHRGCQSNNQCLACPRLTNITVASNTQVLLSKACTHYVPHNNFKEFAVHLSVVPGAKNVKIIGRGTVTSDTWPLSFRAPLFVGSTTNTNADPSNADNIVFKADQLTTSAIQVTSGGLVQVSATAPNFRTLVVVAGMRAIPLRLKKKSYIAGHAREAIVGLGHVSGHVSLMCTSNATQHYVVQEIRRNRINVVTSDKYPCTEVNLTRLLGFYGSEYEEMFYDDYNRDNPPWRAVKIAGTVAVVLGLVLLFSNQPSMHAKKQQ